MAAGFSFSSSRSRHPVRWILAGLLLAVLAFVLVSEVIGWRYLRGPAEAQLSKKLGVEVRLGAPFTLHVLRPPELSLGSLWLQAAAGSDAPFLADAHDLHLQWRWSDLLASRRGDPLRVKGIEAGSIEAYLKRDANGFATWSFKKDEQPKDPNGATAWPKFDRLQLTTGSLHIDDKPLALQLEAHFNIDERASTSRATAASSAQAAAPAGSPPTGFSFDATGTYRKLPTRLALRSPQVLPFLADGGTPPIQVKATASVGGARAAYEGTLIDLLGSQGLDGSFALSGSSLGAVGEPLGVTLPTTPGFSLRGRLLKNDPVWHVNVAGATIGRSRLAGDFAYDPQPPVPKLTGTLKGSRLALADLSPAVGGATGSGVKTARPASATGPARLLPDKHFDLPSLRAMDADVQVSLDQLDLETAALDSLRPLKGRIVLAAGVLRIENLDARTAGGSLAGMTQLDSTTQPPSFKADLRWRGIDLAGWLRGARKDTSTVSSTSAPTKLKTERVQAREGKAPVTAYLTGELQGRAELTGRGSSTSEILASLDGHLQALVREGTISHLVIEAMGIDIAQALGVWIKGDESLPLNCAAVVFDAQRGVLTPRVAVIDTSVTTVGFTGTVDLSKEQIDLRGVVHPKNFTFVALRSPLRIEGAFSKPAVRLEAAPIATRLAASVALALVNPLAAVLPLFDPGDGPRDGCRAFAAGFPSASASSK